MTLICSTYLANLYLKPPSSCSLQSSVTTPTVVKHGNKYQDHLKKPLTNVESPQLKKFLKKKQNLRPHTHYIRICVSTRFPGDCPAHSHLRSRGFMHLPNYCEFLGSKLVPLICCAAHKEGTGDEHRMLYSGN